MVKHHRLDAGQACDGIQETPVERNYANFATSFFVPDTRMSVEHRRPEFHDLRNNIASTENRQQEFRYQSELSDGLQTNRLAATCAYVSANEGSLMTDQHRRRQAIVMRRTGQFDSTDGNYSPRNSTKYESEYECMSSPECVSNSSSNRSSNTGSFYGNISPDTLSLASFAGRLNFGRFGGSKRSSQSSSSSSQDSGRQSWGKTRDSFDLSDAGPTYFVRRPSGEQVYENTRPFTPENFMRFSKSESDHMEVTDGQDETPPPLPSRQNQAASTPNKEPEMILPYKVVDLDELQRSLEDIEPYYISHDGTGQADKNLYNECSDPIEDVESDDELVLVEEDIRPVLPPKKKNLRHTQSDSSTNASTNGIDLPGKERPIPLPRQSLILSNFTQPQVDDGTVQTAETDESGNLAERSVSASGHFARQRNRLPAGPVSKNRRDSASPASKTNRPMRSAPPPPPLPPRSLSSGERGSSSRPVSEMFPRGLNADANSSMPLKRSLTVSVLHSPFHRRPVESVGEERNESENPGPTATFPKADADDGKTKEDAGKGVTSKSATFFGKTKVLKKALSTLKIPGTKKTAKKEITISPPSDFTSLCQTRITTDYSNRGRKAGLVVTKNDNGSEPVDSDASVAVCETAVEIPEPKNAEFEVAMEDIDVPMGELSFHPEFTKLPAGHPDHPSEQFYYNFPLSQDLANGTKKTVSPQKPPRSGYLQPSLSQRTIEQEEEINRNKLPELGPLPTPPEGSSCPDSPNASPVGTPESDSTTDNDSTAATSTDADYEKANNGKADKAVTKAKPEVPRRPNTLKLKPKVPNRPVLQSCESTPIPRSMTLDTATIEKSRESTSRADERRHSTPLEDSSARSRSCDFLDIDDPCDNYITDMHLIVLKDILRCWRNLLRKPKISLSGACWEDFEFLKSESWQSVSADQSSISLPVRLRYETTKEDSNFRCEQFIAKIKCETQANACGKSHYDQDYSVCSSVPSHENISRVLAYFRGDVPSSILGLDEVSSHHTTISISDQVPSQSCADYVSQSKDTHHKDPLSYERTICMLLLQCVKGVIYLHDSGFTHGNLNLDNLFLIEHDLGFQLLIGNFGSSQPLPKERHGSNRNTNSDSPSQSGVQDDLTDISEILMAMLHMDHNGNGTHTSKAGCATLSGYLRTASEKLRDRSVSPHQVVRFLQALLWGPFRLGESIVIVSESRMKQWLERQRSEFIARLAMDEALARTVGENSKKFSVEDLLLCEYLTVATPSSLVRTEKCWFLDT